MRGFILVLMSNMCYLAVILIFFGGYLVVAAHYLVVTARYRSLLLVPTFSMNATNQEIVLLSNCILSSPNLLQVSSKATDFRVFNSPKLGSRSVSTFRGQDRVVVVGQQPKTEQWKVHTCLEISDNNIIRCLKEELGGLLSRTQNKGLMAKTVRQGSYKRTRTAGSKVWHNDVHKNVSNYSSLTNGQYSSTLTFEEEGGENSQQDSFKFSQGNMGLPISKLDQDYYGIPTRCPQPRSRFLGTLGVGLEQVVIRSRNLPINLENS